MAKQSAKNATMPTKRTINLFYRSDRTTRPATIALYCIFVIVVILALAKVLFFDLYNETTIANENIKVSQEKLAQLDEQLSDYSKIELEYLRYADPESNIDQVDRLQILDILEKALNGNGTMSTIGIKGASVQLQVNGLTLSQIAEVSKKLELDENISSISVETAASSTAGEGNPDLVSATIDITLAKGAN